MPAKSDNWTPAIDATPTVDETETLDNATSPARKLNKKFIAGAALAGLVVVTLIVRAVRSDDETETDAAIES